MLSIAPSAMASVLTRARVASFGTDGTAATSFGNPGALAFNQASDKLYVLNKVDFSGTTALLHAFNTPSLDPSGGVFPETLPGPNSGDVIAVDNTAGPSAGHIFYVAAGTLYGFDSSGTPLGGNFPVSLPGGFYIGAAVDSAGNVYVANAAEAAQNIRKYDSAGNFLSTISTASVGGAGPIAFDSNDDLYFSIIPLGQVHPKDGNGNALPANEGAWKATAASGYSAASFTQIHAESQAFHSPQALAVDGNTHTVYIAEASEALAYNGTTGALLYHFADSIANAVFLGMAIDQGADTVYISDLNDFFSPGAARVHAFSAGQSYSDASATPDAVKNVTDSSAELSATIADNNVLPTDWRLELSSDGGTSWSTRASGQTTAKSANVASTGFSTGTLTVKASGGTFKLAFGGKKTPAITYNASAAAVQVALQALSSIGIGNVEVTGGPGSASGSTPYNITFTGALAGTNVSNILTDALSLVGAPVKVSQTVTGLNPNSDYKFRVVTNKGSNALTEAASYALSFKTLAPPPVVTDVGAVQVADTSARLVATIDPRNTETAYVFQYGTTPGLGSSTVPLNIGSGTTPITVSQVVSGLAKDTTYYFKLVATNLSGTTASASKVLHTRTVPFPVADAGNCANQAVREEQRSTFLPDCRAYEMVSPPDKNQGGVDQSLFGELPIAFGMEGDAALYCTNAVFGEPPSQAAGLCGTYLSRRTGAGPTGWETEDPLPRFCAGDRNGFEVGQLADFTDNLRAAVIRQPDSSFCQYPMLDPSAPDQSPNLYRADFASTPTAFDYIASPKLSDGFGGAVIAGGSEDLSHTILRSRANLTPEPDSPPPGSFAKLYEWVREGSGGCLTPGGCLRLASVKPDGTPFTGQSDFPLITQAPPLTTSNAVSDDGERIYFQNATGGTAKLYMRESGNETFSLSTPECEVSADCGADESAEGFIWASPSGDVALFFSCDKLTDASDPSRACADEYPGGSGSYKLYRWDREAPPGARLTDLTVDEEPADDAGPDALGILGASDDGSVVYVINRGQLVSGVPTGSIFGTTAKIFRVEFNGGDPTTTYLGPYRAYVLGGEASDEPFLIESNNTSVDPNVSKGIDGVTPDGAYLAVTSPLPMDPAADRDSDLDAYRWDEQGGWICVSCQLPGVPSAGSVNNNIAECCETVEGTQRIVRGVKSHLISEDGQRIFFTARDALVPADVNGELECPKVKTSNHTGNVFACQDAYEWHDGTVGLLTSGRGVTGATLLGVTADGHDVGVLTRERLVGWDKDNGSDIYDIRAQGGFPEPPAQPATCEGEACRGPGTSPAATTGAGSAAFEGPGNQAVRPTCPKGKRPVTRKGKTRCAKPRHRHAKRNRRAAR